MLGLFLSRSLFCLFLFFFIGTASLEAQTNSSSKDYSSLVDLFYEWREFENPPLLNGAPNYTKNSFNKRHVEFKKLKARLKKIDVSGWERAQKIDFEVVLAEMNGYDFNYRVLRPWQRAPAFYQTIWTYQSDVPAHEGPTNHAVLELWTYSFPLTKQEKERLTKELLVIPPLLKQARKNLTGNAQDLWVAGIKNLEKQEKVLAGLQEKINNKTPALVAALEKAKEETSFFVRGKLYVQSSSTAWFVGPS